MSEDNQILMAAGFGLFMAILLGILSHSVDNAVLVFLGVFILGLVLFSLEDRGK